MAWAPIYPKTSASLVGGKNSSDNIRPDGPAGQAPPRVQTVKVPYTITDADVLAGYAAIPVVWPVAWPDTNYTIAWGLHDFGPVASLNNAVGDIHDVTPAGFIAVIALLPAIPLIQGQQISENVSTSQVLSFVTTLSGLYQITFFCQNLGTGDASQNLEVEYDYTDLQGNAQVIGPYDMGFNGNVASTNNYNIPVLAKGATDITIKITLTGTGTLNYNAGLTIVRMPVNAISDAGNNVEIEAVSVEDWK